MSVQAPVRTAGPAAARRAWVEQVMGMPVSVHVRGEHAHDRSTARAVGAVYAQLRDVDRTFSPYRADSQISRYQRGELALADCDPEVLEVHRLCLSALVATDGAVDAWRWSPAGYDPTGVVKGWAVERALTLLDDVPGDVAIDAGGDLAVRADPAGPGWLVAVEDPRERGGVVATVRVHTGAVATSGTAARGRHLIDPATREPAANGVLSATVVGPSLTWADVWASAVAIRGGTGPGGTSGVVVPADGPPRTWG